MFSVDDGNEPFFSNRSEYVCDEKGLISRVDIRTRLNKLDCNKAPGRDKVSQYILKIALNNYVLCLKLFLVGRWLKVRSQTSGERLT